MWSKRVFVSVCLYILSCTAEAQSPVYFSMQLSQYEYSSKVVAQLSEELSLKLNRQVIHRKHKSVAPDIIISDSRHDNSDFKSSLYSIYTISSHIKISNPNADPNAPLGIVDNAFTLLENEQHIKIKTVEQAAILLQKKVIRAVIDLSNNEVGYRFLDKEVVVTPYKPNTLLKVYFRTEALWQKYNDNLLTSNVKLKEEKSVTPKDINFMRIFKFFEPEKKAFEPLVGETKLLDWLHKQHFSDLKFNFTSSNTQTAFTNLKQSDNTCILNVLKNDGRKDIAYFSLATASYIPRALFVQKNSAIDNALSQMAKPIALQALLKQNPRFYIGYWRRTDNELNNFLVSTEVQKNNFVNLSFSKENNRINYNAYRQFDFVEKDRVQGLLEYPLFVNEVKLRKNSGYNYRSYQIKSTESNSYSYVACSKSETGRSIISRLNALLRQENFRNNFFGTLVPTYSDSELDRVLNDITSAYSDTEQ